MQYVYEKSECSETIILAIEPVDDFVIDFPAIINTLVRDIYRIHCFDHTNVKKSDLIDSKYENGCHLLNSDKEVFLIQKDETVNSGYIYNSKDVKLQDLFTWKLLSSKFPLISTEPEITEEVITLPTPARFLDKK